MNARKAVIIALAGAAAVATVVALLWTHQDEPPRPGGSGSSHRENHSAEVESKGVVASAPRQTDTPSTQCTPPPDARLAVETAPARHEPRQAAKKRSPPSGYEKLANALGLKAAESTPATELMRSYTAKELDLLARVQRATKAEVPEGVLRIIEMHREGADYEAMREEAERVFTGDLMARLAVMTWLRQQYPRPEPVEAPKPRPDKKIRIGGRLRQVPEVQQGQVDEDEERF